MRVELDPQWLNDVEDEVQQAVERAADQVATRARERCPVDSGRLLASIVREHGTARLTEVVACGGPGVEYWSYPEFGTRPHVIRSHGPWPLRDRETGRVFGREVSHPGTPEVAFMRSSLYQEVAL